MLALLRSLWFDSDKLHGSDWYTSLTALSMKSAISFSVILQLNTIMLLICIHFLQFLEALTMFFLLSEVMYVFVHVLVVAFILSCFYDI
jgi:hypothetical protein